MFLLIGTTQVIKLKLLAAAAAVLADKTAVMLAAAPALVLIPNRQMSLWCLEAQPHTRSVRPVRLALLAEMELLAETPGSMVRRSPLLLLGQKAEVPRAEERMELEVLLPLELAQQRLPGQTVAMDDWEQIQAVVAAVALLVLAELAAPEDRPQPRPVQAVEEILGAQPERAPQPPQVAMEEIIQAAQAMELAERPAILALQGPAAVVAAEQAMAAAGQVLSVVPVEPALISTPHMAQAAAAVAPGLAQLQSLLVGLRRFMAVAVAVGLAETELPVEQAALARKVWV